MQLTPEQVKGRIKNVAKENKADARTLMRIYMMERFLERIASSQYKDNFIIKGGLLVTAMVGVALRSTMDIDTSIKNQNLSAEDARRIVNEIKDIDLGDGATFEIKVHRAYLMIVVIPASYLCWKRAQYINIVQILSL